MNKNQINRVIKLIILLIVIIGTYIYKENYYKPSNNKNNINIQNKEKTKEISSEINFKISYIDVGEAESILIQSDGENALIDAGNTIDGNKLVKYFKSLGITNFKYLFGTHAHEDHIGGLANIIYNFNIDEIYMPKTRSKYKSYNNVLKALNKKNKELLTPEIDQRLFLGESIIDILYVGDFPENINNTSIILKLTYKNTSYLFTGDTTKDIELEIVNKDIKSNVLKVAHHGSNDATSAQFLSKVHPEYAIISCGKNNDYHHPHHITLDKLEKIGAKLYRTDIDGTIIVKSDGNFINIETIKTDTNLEEK